MRLRWSFWRLAWQHRSDVLGGPEFIVSLFTGVVAAFLAKSELDTAARVDAVGHYLPVAAALLAIVFAAIAISVALATTRLLEEVEATERGIEGLMWPFIVGIGIQVASVVTTVSFLIVAPNVLVVIEEVWFGLSTGLMTWAVLDLVALGRQVAGMTELRAEVALLEKAERESGESNVREFPKGNGQTG